MNLSDLDTWTLLAWTIAGAWIVYSAIFLHSCRNRPVLRPLTGGFDFGELPRLSVVVAARNETDCIETCVRSLLRQDYPDLEVVAVNDRSTDDTASILDRLAIEFAGRLRVVHVSTLPAGWFGKPHALTLGLEQVTGTLVCFTDADCEFLAPSALRTTVAELLRRDLDFFSVTARFVMSSLRERVTVPCCSETLLSWLRPELVNDPRTSVAYANGAFILAWRDEFDRIGGWGAVRTKISEDLQLARLAKRSGLCVGMVQGEGLYQTRAYRNVRDSWNGWSRIFKGTLSPSQLIVTLVRMSAMFVLPLGALLYGLWDGLRTGDPGWLLQGAGLGFLIAFGLRCTMDVAVFRLMGAPVAAALLAPLGRLFVLAAAIRALLSQVGLVNIHWRGAMFAAGKLVTPRPAPLEPQASVFEAASIAVPCTSASARSIRSGVEILAPDPADAA